jgi:hypothetical protein
MRILAARAWDEYRDETTMSDESSLIMRLLANDQDGKHKLDRSVVNSTWNKTFVPKGSPRQGAGADCSLRRGRTTGFVETRGLAPPQSRGHTRLYLKNMCRKEMSRRCCWSASDIAHIVWRTTVSPVKFLGQAWVEVKLRNSITAQSVYKSWDVLCMPSLESPGGKDA